MVTTAHTNLEIRVAHPKRPVLNRIKSIMNTHYCNSIVLIEGPTEVINMADGSRNVGKASLIVFLFLAGILQCLSIRETAIQPQRIAATLMSVAFLPRAHSCIKIPPMTRFANRLWVARKKYACR